MNAICSINGKIYQETEAVLTLSEIESQYNYGVYETIKVRNNILYFVDQHVDRLFHSANCIALEHSFSANQIKAFVSSYVSELQQESCNLKLLLYAGKTPEDAKLFILSSMPFYPNRKWYKEGVDLVSFQYERWMPQAKTLNMLPSAYFYKKAKENGSYDALLLDNNKNMLEGTRTNIFLIKDTVMYSPPKNAILEGVTLRSIEKITEKTDFKIKYQDLPYRNIEQFDGMILTSTSSKILPVKKVDSFTFKKITPEIIELIKIYDDALETSNGDFQLL